MTASFPMDRKQTLLLLLLGCLGERSICEEECPNSCYCDDANEYIGCTGDGKQESVPNLPSTATRLELTNYNVRVLSASNLNGLELLEELKLQQVNLERVEDKAFANLSRLSTLDLSKNYLVNITSDAFQGLSSLRRLDLSSNLLVYIDEAFVNVSRLEQLNLKSNQLSNLTACTFSGLENLQYLNLDDNKLVNVELGTFQDITNLAHLILSNNPLSTLQRLEFRSSRLQYLDVSHANLEEVPRHLSKFIRDLRLPKNKISYIKNDDFDNYRYIGLIVLDDNIITHVENGTWKDHTYLMKIWLNGNKLKEIPFDLSPSITALYLEENLIDGISDHSFQGLANLKELFLQRNQIKNIATCGFCGLRQLNLLDLQANHLEKIPQGLFSSLNALQTLDLSENNIKFVNGDSFIGLRNLNTLLMSHVKEGTFKKTIFDQLRNLEVLVTRDSSNFVRDLLNSTYTLRILHNLKTLDLTRNEITELRADFPSFFPRLEAFEITENKWHCGSDVLWLSKWIKTAPSLFKDSQNIVCATPPEMEGIPLVSLNENYFTITTREQAFSDLPSHFSFTTQVKYDTKSTEEPITEIFPTSNDKTHSTKLTTTEVNNTVPYVTEYADQVKLNPINNISESTKAFAFWEYNVSNPHSPTQTTATQSTTKLTIPPANRSSLGAINKITLDKSRTNWKSNIILIALLVSIGLIVLIVLASGIAIYSRKKKSEHRLSNTSSSSIIAYCPHKDEVLTAFERANDVGLYHGVGNKLYYIVEDDKNE